MEKFIATILVAIQKFNGLFDDDDAFDPSWMDVEAWQLTRV